MPNLAGIFCMGSSPSGVEAVLARVSTILQVPGVVYETRMWHDDRFGAVNLLTGAFDNLDQPAREDGLVLFLDGDVVNLHDVTKSGANTGSSLSPARMCLQLYMGLGDAFVAELDGQFNILIYDIAKQHLKIFNDRMGYRPLYYQCVNNVATFGLEKKGLFAAAQVTPAFDPDGLFEFMTFGHNLDDHTIYSGIRALPPGSMLEFVNGHSRVSPYWAPQLVRAGERVTLGEAALELERRLTRAVERRVRIPRRYGILLSGGLDSRAVAGSLSRQPREITSFTFGSEDSRDLRYGRELARRLGFRHQRLLYDEISLADLLPKIVWRTEGAVPFNQLLSIVHHRTIRDSSDILFNGHNGDAITGGHLLPGLFRIRGMRALSEHIAGKRTLVSLDASRALFHPAFFAHASDAMMKRLENRLSSFGTSSCPHAYYLWDMTVRQPRFTFCSPSVDRYLIEPVTPFTDRDVVEWMLCLPMKHRFAQRTYKRMISRAYPPICDVPWTRTGRPVPGNFLADVLPELGRIVSRRFRLKHEANSEDVQTISLASLNSIVRSDFLYEALPGDIFSRDAVRAAALAAMEGSARPDALFLLLTVAQCARLFDGGRANPPHSVWPEL